MIKRISISVVLTAILSYLLYYVALPAMTFSSVGFCGYICAVLWIFIIISFIINVIVEDDVSDILFKALGSFAILGVFLIVLMLFVSFCGSRMTNANSYSKLLTVEEGNWNKDMPEVEAVTNIALMDTDTAKVFGERALSSLSKVVSRYDLDEFSQINQNGKAMKVAPLKYDSFFKWNKYKSDGVPGYVLVDPVNTTAKYVELENAIKYSPNEYFSRDLHRVLRREYKTAIMGKHYFELDEKGNPYYITPVYKYTICLWGGKIIDSVIITDACTGKSKKLDIDKVPEWVDIVYDGDYISTLYDYYGELSNGFWNSLFSQTDCKKCTDDYGYITIGNDIWIYTGITSVTGDSSNIGLIMANERTGETKYYSIGGADEKSAMEAAEGEVANYGYKASFPSVVNVNGEPTYIMVLKDGNSIVKEYAMVNLANYSKVVVAETQEEVFAKYAKKMGFTELVETAESVVEDMQKENVEIETRKITVNDIEFIVIDGNTFVYFTDKDGNKYKSKFDERFLFIKEPIDITVDIEVSELEKDIISIYKIH